MRSIIDNVSPSDVEMEPFPHFVVRNPMEDLYNVADLCMPEMAGCLDEEQEENKACRVNASEALLSDHTSGYWKMFVRDHTQSEHASFFRGMMTLFGEKRFTAFPGVRHLCDDFDIVTDCQAVINTPTSGGTTVRDPHVDNPREIYAGLWYFRHPDDDSEGGDLVLYEITDPDYKFHRSKWGKGSVDPKYIRPVKTIKYEADVCVFFLNGPTAIHGVTARGKAMHPRRYINIIAEYKEPLFSLKR